MSEQISHGTINHTASLRKTDYLYRVSMKGLVRNDQGEVLVVKESGRDWWDLPGGGMDHGENIEVAIAREMKEEVNLEGSFTSQVIAVEDPTYLAKHNMWQIRLIYEISPSLPTFSAGEDADEIAFMNPEVFKTSEKESERRIYKYATIQPLIPKSKNHA
ncbi:NUDIX hydrolase [bacterium]|nr:MAG: NUDIX hydrolase [bacterium]